jgi:dienelactone hydrolase
LWNLSALREPPETTYGDTLSDGIREVYYVNEPYRGESTRVYAVLGVPESDEPVPGMVLVHGGGGRAFAEWVRLWNARGYAAISMDLSGRGRNAERLPDGGPEQGDREKFFDMDAGLREMWTYHAIAAAIRGASLLAAHPAVDARRIGVTGISWGGYLTCILAGVDDRFGCAIPVYGCGFLHENSCWLPIFAQMSDAHRERWIAVFDPSAYLPNARNPILWMNGTNDFAYPMDSHQKSSRIAPGTDRLSVTVRMPHSHEDGWAPVEIAHYADSRFRDGAVFAKLDECRLDGDFAMTTMVSERPIAHAGLHYTTDTSPWFDRYWESLPATVHDSHVIARLPEARPTALFLTVTDDRGVTVSTEYVDLLA